jgi:CRP-like cAMP-binding protein
MRKETLVMPTPDRRSAAGRPGGPNPAEPAGLGLSDERLEAHGARLLRVRRGGEVFAQGDRAEHFHLVRSGRVRMVVTSDRGREFTQGYFGPGESFGEPPFFTGGRYPASAEAVEESTVWRCPRTGFLELLRGHPDTHLAVTTALSRRLIYKAMMLGEIAVEEAEHRLATLIRYFRRAQGTAGTDWKVPFTRQQLADMTGLRVETVIRTVKAMEARGVLSIVRGRIVWKDAAARAVYEDLEGDG